MKPLYNHTSEESAFIVGDYPYGRKVRCRIRYWIERSRGDKGFRFCSQTEHPTRLVWNNPKKSTYVRFAACMFQADNGHVEWSGIGEYDDADKVLAFITSFPEADMSVLLPWCMAKQVYSAKGAEGKIVWLMNGIPQPVSQSDIDKYAAECKVWAECCALINKGKEV